MSRTYLTTDELAKRIKYEPRTIRNYLKDSVLLEGIHYFHPFPLCQPCCPVGNFAIS